MLEGRHHARVGVIVPVGARTSRYRLSRCNAAWRPTRPRTSIDPWNTIMAMPITAN